jgi:DNA modification methylase
MMGAGTAEAAAIKLKRKFIGIEIDSDRFQIAKSRLANVDDTINSNNEI